MDVKVETVKLDPSVAQSIKDHAAKEASRECEAVGFLAARVGKSKTTAVVRLNNHASDPHHGFFVEPWEQYRAEKKLEHTGYQVTGIYHSHVNSEALPSQTDHEFSRPWGGYCIVIYSVIFDELRGFKQKDGFLEPVELVIE